jgi:hypothetical protein
MKSIEKYLKNITFILFGFLAIYYLFNLYIYPQRICNGEVTKKLIWTDRTTNEKVVLTDEKTPLVISFILKRGAIYLNDDRFPFYKELSSVDNYAKKTEIGYIGSYTQQGLIDHVSNFKFNFNELTSMLYTENTASGTHLYENRYGSDSLKIDFVGSCSRKFL